MPAMRHPAMNVDSNYRRTTRRVACALVAFVALCAIAGSSIGAGKIVWVLELDGAIGPATADYFVSNLHAAERADAALFLLQLDTPGGLDHSMRDMIKAILASKVPVATYVAPNGSRAASAGTYILYASHIAAMAPATNVGSSTPVSIGGEGSPFPTPGSRPPDEGKDGDKGAKGDKSGDDKDSKPADGTPSPSNAPTTAMERKVINDAVAYIRGLAELRGRNQDWAEKTVREAANLTATDALASHVIDLIATDRTDLLTKLDGRTIKLDGGTATLDLKDPDIKIVQPGWRYELLSVITDPNVAYILLMIGIYGLILEFYHPGTAVPGVIGVICLLLAGYALQMLPVNYAGLALMIVGIGMMIAEAFAPGFGVLGVGGAIAFVIGSVILMDTDLPGYQISLPIIAAFAASSVGVFLFIVGAAIKSRGRKVVTGRDAMIGASAEVLEDFADRGLVRLHGEVWQARSRAPLVKGARVRIVRIDDLVLTVEPQEQT
jgi:membrane-bound serine protease (ClpP class)